MNKNDEISLFDIFFVVANQIRIIILVPSLFLILTFLYLQFLADYSFTSNSKIKSAGAKSTLSNAAGLASQFGLSVPGSSSESDWVYPEIIKSNIIAKSLLKKKFDTEEYGPQKTLLQILTFGNEEITTSLDTLELLGVGKLQSMIEVSENIKTSVFTISLTAKESKLAADINRGLIAELEDYQKKTARNKTSQTLEFIKERIAETQLDLQKAEESLKTFLDRNRRIENSPSLQLEQQRLLREVNVLTSVFTTLKQQLETTKIDNLKESSYIVTVDEPQITLSPSKPKKYVILAIATIIGIVLAVIVAVFNEYFKNVDKTKIKMLKNGFNVMLINLRKLNFLRKS